MNFGTKPAATGFAAIQQAADAKAAESATDQAKAAEGTAAGGDTRPEDNSPEATKARLEQSGDGTKPLDKGGYERDESGPTASDLNIDVEAEQAQKNQIGQAFAEEAAAASGVTAESGEVLYTSHPIDQLHIGPYHFDKGTLRLNSEQAAKFAQLLEDMPLTERRMIAKLDSSKVDRIVQAAATQNFDSSVGRDALANLRNQFPKLGTQAIDGPTAHVSQSQMDGNIEVPLGSTDSDNK